MQKGYTLLELLITLALTAVLLQMAIPGMRALLAGQRASAASNAIIAAIALARSSAIVHRNHVVVCPRQSSQRCGGRADWANGALIFADTDGNRRFDAGELLYGSLPAFESGASLVWRSFRNRSYLLFTPAGVTDWQNGHFQYCPADGNPRFARQIIINAVGRTRLARDKDGDGVAETARGAPLRCS